MNIHTVQEDYKLKCLNKPWTKEFFVYNFRFSSLINLVLINSSDL